MTPAAIFWFVMFAISGLVFFGIALVVSIRGISDLRDLLGSSKRKSKVL
jgi:hypothetical protein